MNRVNKVIVIGTSGGIGHKTAEILLHEGYEIVGTVYTDAHKTSDLKQNSNYSEKTLNLLDIEDIMHFQNSLKDEAIYAVVNCSGVVEFEESGVNEDINKWNTTIAINLSSNFYLAKLFQSNFTENGRFIMISSTDSYYGGAVTASYAASKAGVNSLAKSLSLLFKDKKIRVNAIAPGWVSTPMIEGNSKEFYQQLAESNPLARIADPVDIANVIKFLLSKDADYINGQVITVDGGYTNQDPTLLIEEEEVR